MAFKGDLTNISLFDVFQTLSQNKQTGVLVLTKEGATKKVHISPEGVRIFFTKSFRPLRLGEIFVRRGRITSQDVEILLLEQKKQYRPMGELLVESGKVTEEEVADILRYHAEDEIFEVFGWNSGNFAFYDGQDVGDPATPLSDTWAYVHPSARMKSQPAASATARAAQATTSRWRCSDWRSPSRRWRPTAQVIAS